MKGLSPVGKRIQKQQGGLEVGRGKEKERGCLGEELLEMRVAQASELGVGPRHYRACSSASTARLGVVEEASRHSY